MGMGRRGSGGILLGGVEGGLLSKDIRFLRYQLCMQEIIFNRLHVRVIRRDYISVNSSCRLT